MIKTFLKKQHKFGDDRIEIVSKNLQKYKNDLWQLSWALNSYKPEKDLVDDEEIYENIMVSITEIETKDRKTINGEDVFFPLSVFYRFEIPIERKFLEKKLGIKKETIEQLIGLSEVIETEEKGKPIMLSLHHSSLAELYFGAYQNYPSLGEEIKEKILSGRDEGDLEYCSFYRYMTTTDPKNAADVVISLGKDWEDKKGGKTLIKNLVEEDKIQKSIENGIDKEDDIKKVGSCVSGIARASKEVALRMLESIDINSLSSKINKEKDIDKVGFCAAFIAHVSKEIALKLLDSVSARINQEEDIKKVGMCVSVIELASEEVALKLANNIDINALSSKINKENDIGKIGSCVSGIARASKEVVLKLMDSIEIV